MLNLLQVVIFYYIWQENKRKALKVIGTIKTMKQLFTISILLLSTFSVCGQKRFSTFDSLDKCKNWNFELELNNKLSSIDSDTIVAIKYSYFHTRINFIGVICWKSNGKYNYYTVKQTNRSSRNNFKSAIKPSKSINKNIKKELVYFCEEGISFPNKPKLLDIRLYADGEGGGFDGAGGGEIFICSKINGRNIVFEYEENEIRGYEPSGINWITNLCDLLKTKEMGRKWQI